jgi:hypothetical protein
MVGSAIRDGIDLIKMFLSSEAASFVGGASGGVIFPQMSSVFPG